MEVEKEKKKQRLVTFFSHKLLLCSFFLRYDFVRRVWALESSLFGSFILTRPFLSPTAATQKGRNKEKKTPTQKFSSLFLFVLPSLFTKCSGRIFFPASFIFFLVFVFFIATRCKTLFFFPSLVPFSFFLFASFTFLVRNQTDERSGNNILSFHVLTVCFFAKKGIFLFFCAKAKYFST